MVVTKYELSSVCHSELEMNSKSKDGCTPWGSLDCDVQTCPIDTVHALCL